MNYNKITIGVLGQISTGKSTLINKLIGLDICETGNTKTTSCIIKLKYNQNLGDNDIKDIKEELEDELCEIIEQHNKNYDGKEYKMYEIEGIIKNNNIKNILEKTNNNFEIIDFPGFDEYINQDIEESINKNIFETNLYKSSLKYIDECDVLLYILDSSKIDSKITTDMLNSLKTTSKPILIVLTKCDEYIKHIDENGNRVRRPRRNTTKRYDKEKINENILKIENKYDFPCIGISDKEEFLLEFEAEFNFEKISNMIIKLKDDNRLKFMKIMKIIIDKINSGDRLPFNIYTESKKNYTKYIKKINTISTGVFIAGVGGVGTILSVGLLAIPGIGPIASAATITSSLATIGSIVGGGMISGVVLLSFGTGVVTLSTTTLGLGLGLSVGKFTSNVLIGNMANCILNDKTIEFNKISFNPETINTIKDYLDNGLYKKYKNYIPDIYNSFIYEDDIFIQHDNKLFYIHGLFEHNKIKSISNFYEVSSL